MQWSVSWSGQPNSALNSSLDSAKAVKSKKTFKIKVLFFCFIYISGDLSTKLAYQSVGPRKIKVVWKTVVLAFVNLNLLVCLVKGAFR